MPQGRRNGITHSLDPLPLIKRTLLSVCMPMGRPLISSASSSLCSYFTAHSPSSVTARGPPPWSKYFFVHFPKMPSTGAFLFFLWLMVVPLGDGLKCLDCSGRNCMGSFCEGDYCLMSHYAPRWGTMVWGEPTVVKGCLSGRMLRRGVRSHCETADEMGKEPFTCFCDGKDYCNQQHGKMQRMEIEPVQLYTCICEGAHCRDKKTCIGELCTFVVNHRSKERERGCVNASVPLVERRSAGACMLPPITGSMHHTVAKRAVDLLRTESCVCEGDFCNKEKPSLKNVPENSKCSAFAQVELMGQKMMSKNTTCTGQFCFRAEIKSKLGHMSAYRTMGCASFSRDSQLAEELEPTGCAKFDSEDLQVNVCFKTNDTEAIERAKESRQRWGRKSGKMKTKGGRGKSREMEEDSREEKEEEEEIMEKEETEEEAEEEERDKGHKNGATTGEGHREQGGDGGSRRRELTGEAEEGEEEEEEEEEGEQVEKGDGETEQQQHFIFERPTLAPAVTESNNTALISVFLLLILLILLSGAVWKLQLHKRLFRASYDTVAGG